MQESLSVVLAGPQDLQVRRVPVPRVPGPAVRVRMKACGICGSDLRYLAGENPWSLHTLGRHVPCPPGVILGHEVAGIVLENGRERRVGILAFKGCGQCLYCRTGRENLCAEVQHIGHASGWPEMPHYPGGMAEEFEVWKDFDYDLPDSISFEEAIFLDGLAVAVHAAGEARLEPGKRAGVIGLGPIGMLFAQLAAHRGAEQVTGWDTAPLPVRLARESVRGQFFRIDPGTYPDRIRGDGLDAVIDTVGDERSIRFGLAALRRGGALVLLAVHEGQVPLATVGLSGERRVSTSANNCYRDFVEAIRLMAAGAIRVQQLITHRFPLAEARQAFEVMCRKEENQAYKIILTP